MKLTRLAICYGVTESVWIKNATQDVYLQGHQDFFRNGGPTTWSCGMSNMSTDNESANKPPVSGINNKSRFSHAVRAAIFIKTRGYILTGIHKGLPLYILYAHKYGNMIDMNDHKLTEVQMKNNPQIFEQEFLLSAPMVAKKRVVKARTTKRTNSGVRRSFFPRGATARAVNTGQITLAEAKAHAEKMHDEYEYKRTISAIKNKERRD